MSKFIILSLLLLQLGITYSANIVYLSWMASPSHALWHFNIIEALAARGHNITVLSIDKLNRPLPNVHVFKMESVYEEVYGKQLINLPDYVGRANGRLVELLADWSLKFCNAIGQTEGFKALLNYPNDFKVDLIINDFTFCNCLIGFVHKFKYPPLIGASAYKYTTNLVTMMGGHNYFAYVPLPTFVFTQNMTLFERLENTLNGLYEILYTKYIFTPKFDKLLSKNFKMPDLPHIEELDRKHVLALINTHPSTDFSIPLPPNVIEVGGIQINDPKPLTDDFRVFVESAKKGAILIAFGTNVRSIIFDDTKQRSVVEAVKKFPDYNFIWKFEKDISEGKVANLMVKSWLPQTDILAHPKTKAFITHGGGLGTHEATWFAVPFVSVPFLLDQDTNTHLSVTAGVAIKVDIRTFNANDLENAIRKILEEPSYTERMKLRSLRFRNRPMKPIDTAIWWIEYILRDPNPIHLRSPVLDLGMWKANLYDILLYAVLIFLVVFIVIWKLFCKIRNLFCSNGRKKMKVN